MQDSETAMPAGLEALLNNGQKALQLREYLHARTRELTLGAVEEIRDVLRQAQQEGEESLRALGQLADEEGRRLSGALEQIQHALADAQRIFDRKHHWESSVEPNVKSITELAEQASRLHKDLREKRRELRAREVEQMRSMLIEVERDALAAWGIVRNEGLPIHLEHRLHKATEAISNALKDASTTLDRKKQWEDQVAANAAAVRQELSRLQEQVERTVQALLSGMAEGQVGSDSSVLPGPEDLSSSVAPSTSGAGSAASVSSDLPASGMGDSDPASASPMPPAGLPSLFRRAEEMLKTRRPLEPDLVAGFSEQLQELLAKARQAIPQSLGGLQLPGVGGRKPDREQIRAARARVEELLAQAEAALGVEWHQRRRRKPSAASVRTSAASEAESGAEVATPVPSDAVAPAESSHADGADEVLAAPHGDAGADHDATDVQDGPDELESNVPEDAFDSEIRGDSDTGSHTDGEGEGHPVVALTIGAIRTVQGHLHQVREVLDSGVVPGSERKALWARFRHASDALRRARNQTRTLELTTLRERIQAVCEGALQTNPARTRKSIQELQKAVLECPLTRTERDELLQQLRDAWNASSSRQDQLREDRVHRAAHDMQRLGHHLLRWENRRDNIVRLLERLAAQLDELKDRQKNSSSIGYRVIAEKRMSEVRERVAELKGVLEELNRKVEDVGPRLEAGGWVRPDPATIERILRESQQESERGGQSSEGGGGQGRDAERRGERGDRDRGQSGGGQGGRGQGGRGQGGRGQGGYGQGGGGQGGRGQGGRGQGGGGQGGHDQGGHDQGGRGQGGGGQGGGGQGGGGSDSGSS